MMREIKHNANSIFPTMWEVYTYRNLWLKYSCKTLILADRKWKKEVSDKVLKVFFYEEYERITHDEVKFYNRLFDALQYFSQIGNINASENIAWKLKNDVRFEDDFKESLVKEDFERLSILKLAMDIENRPNAYSLNIDKEFKIQRQHILDDFKHLKEMKAKEPKDSESVDDDITYPEELLDDALLGLLEDHYSIIDVLQYYNKDKDMKKQLLWTVVRFYNDWISDINREYNLNKNLKALKLEAILSANDNEWQEMSKLYFSKMYQLAIENSAIGSRALVAILKHYDNEEDKQETILGSIEAKHLSKGIAFAVEIEEYEIAQQIKLNLDALKLSNYSN